MCTYIRILDTILFSFVVLPAIPLFNVPVSRNQCPSLCLSWNNFHVQISRGTNFTLVQSSVGKNLHKDNAQSI